MCPDFFTHLPMVVVVVSLSRLVEIKIWQLLGFILYLPTGQNLAFFAFGVNFLYLL